MFRLPFSPASVRAGFTIQNLYAAGNQIPPSEYVERNPYANKNQADKPANSIPFFASYNMDLSYSNNRGLIAYKEETEKYILFQFNPTEITDEKEVVYEDRVKTGFDHSDYIWIHGGPRTISFTLELDATQGSRQKHLGLSGNETISSDELFTHDPRRGTLNQVEFLQALRRPHEPGALAPRFIRGAASPSNQFSSPPEVIFVYGNYYLEGVLAELSVRHSLFSRELVPLRTTCELSLKIKEGQRISVNTNLTNIAGQGLNNQ